MFENLTLIIAFLALIASIINACVAIHGNIQQSVHIKFVKPDNAEIIECIKSETEVGCYHGTITKAFEITNKGSAPSDLTLTVHLNNRHPYSDEFRIEGNSFNKINISFNADIYDEKIKIKYVFQTPTKKIVKKPKTQFSYGVELPTVKTN